MMNLKTPAQGRREGDRDPASARELRLLCAGFALVALIDLSTCHECPDEGPRFPSDQVTQLTESTSFWPSTCLVIAEYANDLRPEEGFRRFRLAPSESGSAFGTCFPEESNVISAVYRTETDPWEVLSWEGPCE